MYANEEESTWRGGLHLGFSPYTGAVGAEIQRNHIGVNFGLPGNLGVKYYPCKDGHGWFLGAYAFRFDQDDGQTISGVEYTEGTFTQIGTGAGYKWRWMQHLDLTASLSLAYTQKEWDGAAGSTTEESIYPWPELAIGYTF